MDMSTFVSITQHKESLHRG